MEGKRVCFKLSQFRTTDTLYIKLHSIANASSLIDCFCYRRGSIGCYRIHRSIGCYRRGSIGCYRIH
jgi:hypothetical protein